MIKGVKKLLVFISVLGLILIGIPINAQDFAILEVIKKDLSNPAGTVQKAYVLPASDSLNKETFNDTYLYKVKLDCKNKLIGVKKSYMGSSHITTYRNSKVEVLPDNVKMGSVNKKDIYRSIYNYACSAR